MAQLPSNLAALQAAVPPSDAEAADSLPADLMALSLEELMGLPVRSRAEPDRDDAPRERVRPQETLAAAAPAVAGPGGATAGPDGNGDLPADLTALSLAQLMNLPLRAPQPEPEEEPEAAEDDAEDGETVPEVAQTETDPGSDDDAAPPAPPSPSRSWTAMARPTRKICWVAASRRATIRSRGRPRRSAPFSPSPFWIHTTMSARILRRPLLPSARRRPPAAVAAGT